MGLHLNIRPFHRVIGRDGQPGPGTGPSVTTQQLRLSSSEGTCLGDMGSPGHHSMVSLGGSCPGARDSRSCCHPRAALTPIRLAFSALAVGSIPLCHHHEGPGTLSQLLRYNKAPCAEPGGTANEYGEKITKRDKDKRSCWMGTSASGETSLF